MVLKGDHFTKLLGRHSFECFKVLDKIAGGSKAAGASDISDGTVCGKQKLFRMGYPDIDDILGEVFPGILLE